MSDRKKRVKDRICPKCGEPLTGPQRTFKGSKHTVKLEKSNSSWTFPGPRWDVGDRGEWAYVHDECGENTREWWELKPADER